MNAVIDKENVKKEIDMLHSKIEEFLKNKSLAEGGVYEKCFVQDLLTDVMVVLNNASLLM